MHSIIKALLILPAALLPAFLALAAEEPGIDGKWFRYPGQVDPLEIEGITPPEPVPDPPLKAEYLEAWREERARFQEAEEAGRPIATGYTRCLPDGMPAMMQGMFPMEVLESRGQVTIIQEAYNQVRRIYLDEEPVPYEEAEPRFWGHSVGRWDGDTLEVETVGIKEYVEFRNVPHSNQMRIDEKIRLVSDNVMENIVTVTDPVYLDRPWQWRWLYVRDPDYKLYEYVCEDNREYADETGAARLRLFGAEE